MSSVPLLLHMARNGWLVVSINYRLAPRAKFPAQLLDCKRALAWVKRNIHMFGGDANFIIAAGESAGGHLAALVGLTAHDKSLQPGFEDQELNVQGALRCGGGGGGGVCVACVACVACGVWMALFGRCG